MTRSDEIATRDSVRDAGKDRRSVIRRRSSYRVIENWMWRTVAFVLVATILVNTTDKTEILVVPLSQSALASDGAQAALIRRAQSPSVVAVVIEAGDLLPDPQTVERWHAFLQRLARAAPTAVALNGDVTYDAIAMFAPVERIFARETGLLLPGLLGAKATETPAIAQATAQQPGAAEDTVQDLAENEAVRLAVYRTWMQKALQSSPHARAGGILLVEKSNALSSHHAISLGLVDDIGFAQDALDWAFERSGVSRAKTRIAFFSLPD